ncbi:inhibitor of apoptosis-promoting Bax1-domain-containing protein [Tribonema minus]|uniref:Inhibitor of apoptosis-promoting Bax1-domain-containing protein n=1 Tax=Tribonema minus TaxID=303371 RepID=A0A835ZDG7_9STRA|nr:inhibitor of apoptosis-promoting Bax1-domain-containing protein [Tribonema minus]
MEQEDGEMKAPMMPAGGPQVKDEAMYAYKYQDVESGLPTAPGYVAGFDREKELRRGFIRKVYTVLSLQLMLTCGVCAIFTFVDPVRNYMLSHMWPFYTSMFGGLAVLFLMFCYQNVHPTNIVLLTAWTLMESVLVGTVVASYASAGAGGAVVNALFLTLTIFAGLTLFTFQSKIDFSFLGAALFGSLFILMIWGFVISIFGWQPSFWYSLIGAIIFSLYILFDTSLIMNRLSPDDWVLACISLYLDIINLFLFILQLTSRR